MTAKVVPIGAARSLESRRRTRRATPGRPLPYVPESFADLPVEFLLDVDPEELREFLDADAQEVGADPVFKERLRRELWRMLCAYYEAAH